MSDGACNSLLCTICARYDVIDRDDEIAAGTRRACIIFLSDGGPGDLVRVPPALGEEQMESQVGHRKLRSAVTLLRELASRLRDQLDVHMIGAMSSTSLAPLLTTLV